MPYPGGKGRCYQHIVSMMLPHRVYIETHLGGGAVLRHKRPAEVTIALDIDPAVISAWPNCAELELYCTDAVQFLRQYPFRGDELVYCDPPYLPQTRRKPRIYRYEYSVEQHLELLSVLRDLPCAVILSGYRSELYARELAGWRSVEFPGDSHAGPRVEVAWLNYDLPSALHDYSHMGSDFRARERIRRRRTGLTRRIDRLDPLERKALFHDLARVHGPELRQALSARTTP